MKYRCEEVKSILRRKAKVVYPSQLKSVFTKKYKIQAISKGLLDGYFLIEKTFSNEDGLIFTPYLYWNGKWRENNYESQLLLSNTLED